MVFAADDTGRSGGNRYLLIGVGKRGGDSIYLAIFRRFMIYFFTSIRAYSDSYARPRRYKRLKRTHQGGQS